MNAQMKLCLILNFFTEKVKLDNKAGFYGAGKLPEKKGRIHLSK